MIWFFAFTGMGLTATLLLLLSMNLYSLTPKRVVGGALLLAVAGLAIRHLEGFDG